MCAVIVIGIDLKMIKTFINEQPLIVEKASVRVIP